ncbi:brother of CDO-like [Saccostrea echinata]|uniref:brother of CDO-like n=1 Tax=Saccostrea echinata TaxID=191078 RepID=UPI002A8033CB|nr:brother of CDO-like [Saccostrea echinata]
MHELKVIEGQDILVTCSYTAGNPPSTTVYWTKQNSYFRQYQQNLTITNVSRSDSGTYVCFAENTYSSGRKGTSNNTLQLDVQYGPTVNGQTVMVSEGQQARMSVTVTSNPASNVSWFRDSNLLYTQRFVNKVSTYSISRTQCNDTGRFRVIASNGIRNNYSTHVLLYVYCSPRLNPLGNSVDIPVGNNKSLDGDVTILSYPQPNYKLTLPNGAPNTHIGLSISTNTTNIFRITLRRSNIQPEDYGLYKLAVSNGYGTSTVDIRIFPRSRPLKADQVLAFCGSRKAHVTWQSSYFGYEDQKSFVQYSTNLNSVVYSNDSGITSERIKQELLHVTVSSLQDSANYFFKVVTINRYGFSLSSVVNCTTDTSKEDTSTAHVTVGAVLGILLALSITALAFMCYKYLKESKAKKGRSGPYDAIEKGKTDDTNPYEKYQYRETENHELSMKNLYSPEPKQKDQVIERLYENTDPIKSPKDKIKPKIKPKPHKIPKPIS